MFYNVRMYLQRLTISFIGNPGNFELTEVVLVYNLAVFFHIKYELKQKKNKFLNFLSRLNSPDKFCFFFFA